MNNPDQDRTEPREDKIRDAQRKIAAGHYDDPATEDQALENLLTRAAAEAGLQPME